MHDVHFIVVGDTTSRLPATNNLAGGPAPTVIVGTYSGGTKASYYYEVFRLGSKTSRWAKLSGGQFAFTFGDFGHNRRLRAAGKDPTFANWHASAVDSPYPAVVVELKPNGWRLCLDKMRVPSYPKKESDDLIDSHKAAFEQEAKESNEFKLTPDVWTIMLNMIYSGHASDAWKLLDRVWPKGKLAAGLAPAAMSKHDFVGEFKKRMHQSPYWSELVVLNKGSL